MVTSFYRKCFGCADVKVILSELGCIGLWDFKIFLCKSFHPLILKILFLTKIIVPH
jgi:hypothetical protein